jgi:hypothetical protein
MQSLNINHQIQPWGTWEQLCYQGSERMGMMRFGARFCDFIASIKPEFSISTIFHI